MIDHSFEHLCSFDGVGGLPPEAFGDTGEGLRVRFQLTGGGVRGPKINGSVRAGGGDWMTVRRDGVGLVDARVTFETADGALILVTYNGVIDFGARGYEQFVGEGPPERAAIRVAARLSSGHPTYSWLNRVQCIGIGEFRHADRTASYDIYAIR